jgi:O-antigen/teichoic acid export membrane protein
MKKLAIIHNFLGAFYNFAFLFFTSILLLPYYFKFISTEDYGIWLTGISLLSLTSVLEANISLILTQQLGNKWVNNNLSEFSKYYFAAIILGILIFSFILLSTYFLKDSIANWISTQNNQSSLFSKSFFVYSISLGLGILTGFISSLTQVLLKTKWPPVFNLLSAILGVTYTIWAVSFQGVLAIAFGLLIKNLVYFLLISGYSFFLIKKEKIPFLFEISYVKKIIKNIGLPFISKLAMTIASNSQNFIIGITIAATTTTIFDITKKIPFIIIMVINMVGVSTFTSFSLFYSEQKYNIIHPYTKHYFTFIRILLLILLFPAFILGKDFIYIWVGLDKFGGNVLLAMICFTALLDQLRVSLSQQYYTIGKYNFTSITDAFFALIFILLAFVFIPIYKLNGIVLAGIVANVLYFIFCFVYEKFNNISLVINVLNLSFFIDIIGIVLLTIITKFTYEIFDDYYLKIMIALSSIIIVLLLTYKRHKIVFELILTNFLKINKN